MVQISNSLNFKKEKGDEIMINVIATVLVKEGKMSEFLKIFKANIPYVLEEKGCIEYAPTIDVPADLPPQIVDSNVVTIIEKWSSLDDLRTHLSAPHMLSYRKKVVDIIDNVTLKVLKEA
jgi:quinol monooxygenase YgiN